MLFIAQTFMEENYVYSLQIQVTDPETVLRDADEIKKETETNQQKDFR